jgi:hypothetical protein
MNVLKLEQREEVIALIEKQLMEQHDFAKDSIEPVSLSFASPRFPNHSIDSDILHLIKLLFCFQFRNFKSCGLLWISRRQSKVKS